MIKLCQRFIDVGQKAHELGCQTQLLAAIMRVQLVCPTAELRLGSDFSPMDLGWLLVEPRPEGERVVMNGLLHFDGVGDWTSHT